MIVYSLKLQDENETEIKAVSVVNLYEEIFRNSYKYQLRNWLDYESIPDSIFEENIDVSIPNDLTYIANGLCKKKGTNEYFSYDVYQSQWKQI